MKYKISMSALMMCLVAFFASCVSDCTPQAVEKARKYVLEKMPGLSNEMRHMILYTTPSIMREKMIGFENDRNDKEESRLDIHHTCIAWKVPDEEDTYIMAVGITDKTMEGWEPIRAIKKKFVPPEVVEKDGNDPAGSDMKGESK